MHPWVTAGGILLGGAGMFAWGAVHPQSQLFGPTIRFTGDSSSLALTFDDGPNPAVTPRLLDLLSKQGIPATFFLMGRHVRACPELAREIAERGHVVANHTETHPGLTFLTPARLHAELSRCHEAIAERTGVAPRWMRPPFGFRGPALSGAVREMKYQGVVMWSKWAWDWKPQAAERVIRRLRSVTGGDIVLLHDGDHRALDGDRQHTLAALEHWLPRWKDAGIRFETMDAIGTKRSGKAVAAAEGKS